MMTEREAIESIQRCETVTVAYHVERYGPGKLCHTWGAPMIGEASGPEGFLRLGVDGDGQLIIDEWEDWCPQGMQGMAAGDGGMYISTEAEIAN